MIDGCWMARAFNRMVRICGDDRTFEVVLDHILSKFPNAEMLNDELEDLDINRINTIMREYDNV